MYQSHFPCATTFIEATQVNGFVLWRQKIRCEHVPDPSRFLPNRKLGPNTFCLHYQYRTSTKVSPCFPGNDFGSEDEGCSIVVIAIIICVGRISFSFFTTAWFVLFGMDSVSWKSILLPIWHYTSLLVVVRCFSISTLYDFSSWLISIFTAVYANSVLFL